MNHQEVFLKSIEVLFSRHLTSLQWAPHHLPQYVEGKYWGIRMGGFRDGEAGEQSDRMPYYPCYTGQNRMFDQQDEVLKAKLF